MDRQETFTHNGVEHRISFVEEQAIQEGVVCQAYAFAEDSTRDLGIVQVAKGYKTPRQRVLLGDATIEGSLKGSGTLTIESEDGGMRVYPFGKQLGGVAVQVQVGEIMQWHADHGAGGLTFYEICEPPFTPDRFENL